MSRSLPSHHDLPHRVDGLVHLLGDHVDLVCRRHVLVPQQLRDDIEPDSLPEQRRGERVPLDIQKCAIGLTGSITALAFSDSSRQGLPGSLRQNWRKLERPAQSGLHRPEASNPQLLSNLTKAGIPAEGT